MAQMDVSRANREEREDNDARRQIADVRLQHLWAEGLFSPFHPVFCYDLGILLIVSSDLADNSVSGLNALYDSDEGPPSQVVLVRIEHRC